MRKFPVHPARKGAAVGDDPGKRWCPGGLSQGADAECVGHPLSASFRIPRATGTQTGTSLCLLASGHVTGACLPSYNSYSAHSKEKNSSHG